MDHRTHTKESQSSRRPIQVYLDSSDYSRISNPQSADQFLPLVTRLKELTATGDVEVRFSSINVVEAAPVAAEHAPMAKLRLSLMKDLCGNKCLIDHVRLMEREVSEGFDRIASRRDDGVWFPFPDDLELPDVHAVIREQIASMRLPRKQRRAMRVSADGRLPPALRKQLVEGFSAQSIEDCTSAYPVDETAARAILKFMQGAATRHDVIDALSAAFANLENIGEWYERHWDRLDLVSAWLRRGGEGIRQRIQSAAEAIRASREKMRTAGADESQIEAMTRRFLKEQRAKQPTSFAMTLAERMESADQAALSWETSPGCFTLGAVSFDLLRRSAETDIKPRSPLRSDFGDALHCLYLPYVDVFRADKFVANALAEVRLPYETTVVRKLEDLMGAIDTRLSIPPHADPPSPSPKR